MAQKNFFSLLAPYLDLLSKSDLTKEGIEQLADRFSAELKPSGSHKDSDRVHSIYNDIKGLYNKRDSLDIFLYELLIEFKGKSYIF